MDTINVHVSRSQPHLPAEIQHEAAQQVHHSPNLRTPGLAMSKRLQKHFEPHLEKNAVSGQPAPPASSARNAELDAIRADRAQRLEEGGFTENDMETVEKNAARADRLFASIKSGMGGTPFAVLTLAGNFKPSILQVSGIQPSAKHQAASDNAMSSVFAHVADVTVNKMMAGSKPGYYLKPASDTLHPALQQSVAEKLLALDKGPLRNAFDEANKWLLGFAIRNTGAFALTLGMTAAGKESMDAIMQAALRPITAIIVGVLIEHYNVSRDRANHIADPAMLYGRRDAVPEGQPNKPADQESEWLDEFKTLKDLDANALTKMVSARLGEGAAVALNALISGDAFKEVLDPASMGGGALLTAGFSAMGAGTVAAAELGKEKELGKIAATALSEGVKNVLGTLAFGLWAAGASLGESLPKKATEAINDRVPKAIEEGLDKTGRGVIQSGQFVGRTSLTTAKFVHHTAASAARHTGSALEKAGEGIVSAAGAIGATTQSTLDKAAGALRQRPVASAQGQPAQGQNIPLRQLAATQAPTSSSSTARPSAQDGSDMV